MKQIIKSIIGALILSCALAGTVLAADTVNINTADAATLAESIVGVGTAKAEAIIRYREKNGPFKSVEQLAEVPGVGERTVEQNRAVLRVDDGKKKSEPTPVQKQGS
jgi:competence protein ComEA